MLAQVLQNALCRQRVISEVSAAARARLVGSLRGTVRALLQRALHGQQLGEAALQRVLARQQRAHTLALPAAAQPRAARARLLAAEVCVWAGLLYQWRLRQAAWSQAPHLIMLVRPWRFLLLPVAHHQQHRADLQGIRVRRVTQSVACALETAWRVSGDCERVMRARGPGARAPLLGRTARPTPLARRHERPYC